VAEILNSEEPVGEADVVRPTESQADIIADRSWSTPAAPAHLNPLETVIFTKLSEVFRPETLSVQDISGGCGSMYGIEICAEEFRGLGLLKQQRAVIKVLKGVEGFDSWHGVQVKTSVPKA
jgi:stress-induced morphogen